MRAGRNPGNCKGSFVGHRGVRWRGQSKRSQPHPRLERDRQFRVGVLIQIQQAGLRILTGGKQFLRHPRQHWRTAAHDQRGHGTDAKHAATVRIHAAVRCQSGQRAIEPAGVDRARPRNSTFENILAVE